MADVVSISRIRPMLVDRSALSGIAGNYSDHPLRTHSVLADAAGTVHAVFVWSVNLCPAVAAVSRFQPGCTVAPQGAPVVSVGVSCDPRCSVGFPAVAWIERTCAFARFGQLGSCCCRTWRLAPLFEMAGEPFNAGASASHVPEGYAKVSGTVGAGGARGKLAFLPRWRCALRVCGQACARSIGEGSLYAGSGVRQDPYPAYRRDATSKRPSAVICGVCAMLRCYAAGGAGLYPRPFLDGSAVARGGHLEAGGAQCAVEAPFEVAEVLARRGAQQGGLDA